MPRLIDQAVCLRHWDWSETSQTVSILTRSHGVVRGLAKGSKREKSPFSGGLEIATRGEVVLIPKAGTLATITAWDLQELFPGVRRSTAAFFAAMHILDLAHHFVQEGDPHPIVFETLCGSLRELAQRNDLAPVLAMQWTCLVEAGLQPMLDRSASTGAALESAASYGLSPSLGGVVPDLGTPAAPGVLRVRGETIALLRRLEPGTQLPADAIDAGTIDRAARLMSVYIHHALGRAMTSADALFGKP